VAASSEATGPAAPAAAAPRRLGPIPLDLRTAIVAGAAIGLSLLVMWAGTGYRYEPYVEMPAAPSAGRATAGERDVKQLATRLRGRERQLLGRLKATAPRGVYIVIDQTHNRLYLKKDDETLLEAVCSAGSGLVLKEGSGKKRQWVFDTPRGAFEVLSRSQKPVWSKPDWAFVEEGQPIPKNPADRLEYGSLGEYALNFGNGYMIHGTLYERLLGRAVSHGCIRVGRDDLRKVWAAAGLGTHIYIY
jgi:L,D-transpeptidase YbiS